MQIRSVLGYKMQISGRGNCKVGAKRQDSFKLILSFLKGEDYSNEPIFRYFLFNKNYL
jgi:hypothetical protein